MKPSLSLIAYTRYPDMWGIQNTLSLSNNPEKTASRQLSLFKIILLTVCGCFCSLEVIIVSQRFYLRYPDMWVQYILSCSNTHEKVSHDFHFFENPPFDNFCLLCLTFLMAPMKYLLYLIVSMRYPDMQGVQNTLSLSKPLEKVYLLWKSPFWPILMIWAVPDGSLEVLIVSDWFH